MIVTVTPTVMSGRVVRWHLSEIAEEMNEPQVSASRDGVLVHGYLHMVQPEILTAATAAYEALSRDSGVDLEHLATHRRRGLRGPLVPIEEATPSE